MPDPEFPILAVGDAGEEAADRAYCFTAHEEVAAVGEQIAHQQAAQDVAGGRMADIGCIDERIGSNCCDGAW